MNPKMVIKFCVRFPKLDLRDDNIVKNFWNLYRVHLKLKERAKTVKKLSTFEISAFFSSQGT